MTLVITLVITGGSAQAGDACDQAGADKRVGEITRLLDDQARRTRQWNLGWGIGFTAVAVTQGIFAWKPAWAPVEIDDDERKGVIMSSTKAAIAGVSRFVLPLKAMRFQRAEGEDACSALARAEKALRFTAKQQKAKFWLNHLGGLLINGTAVLVLGLAYDAWGVAALSFFAGATVGAVSTYTMPRGAWKAQRRWLPGGLSVQPILQRQTRGLAFGWQF